MKKIKSIHGDEFVVLPEKQHMQVILELLTLRRIEAQLFGSMHDGECVLLERCTGSYGAIKDNRNEPEKGHYWTNSWIWCLHTCIYDDYFHFPFPTTEECPLPPIPKKIYDMYRAYRKKVNQIKRNEKRRKKRAKA